MSLTRYFHEKVEEGKLLIKKISPIHFVDYYFRIEIVLGGRENASYRKDRMAPVLRFHITQDSADGSVLYNGCAVDPEIIDLFKAVHEISHASFDALMPPTCISQKGFNRSAYRALSEGLGVITEIVAAKYVLDNGDAPAVASYINRRIQHVRNLRPYRDGLEAMIEPYIEGGWPGVLSSMMQIDPDALMAEYPDMEYFKLFEPNTGKYSKISEILKSTAQQYLR